MLVDPYSGQPIDASFADNIGQNFGQTVAGAYGANSTTNAKLFAILGHMPTAKQTMGWNAWRASRTVTHGGLSPLEARGMTGRLRNHNPFIPRSLTRFTGGNVITGANDSYTPFDILSRSADWMARQTVGRGWMNTEKMSSMGLMDSSFDGGKGYFFSSGTYPLISAASTVARTNSQRKLGKSLEFVGGQDPELFANTFKLVGSGGKLESHSVAALVSSVPRGRYSQMISGYMSGARGFAGPDLTEAIRASRPAWAAASDRAAAALAKGGIEDAAGKIGLAAGRDALMKGGAETALALGAREAGAIIPGVDVAMAIWTLHDIAKMGMAAMGGGVTLAKDAMVSFRGQISKPVMGMGYKDNTVAATSRARGVAAIQASQLNARNVLGNEAAGLAAHFG